MPAPARASSGARSRSALVLIHGLGGSARWWDAVTPALTRSHRVIRFDLLGHGRSAEAGDYSIEKQGNRIGRSLDRLGVRRAVLVGHSTGGYVATALAEQRDDLVAGLVLVDTGPRRDAFTGGGLVSTLIGVPVLAPLLWRLRTDGLIRRGLRSAFAPGFPVPQQCVDDTRGMTHQALAATSRAAEDYLGRSPMPERLAPLGKPLLVIFGEQDRRWRPSSAALYPGRVELLPGSGHSPMIEQPARTAGLLLDFTSG